MRRESNTFIAIPPGATIKEILNDRGMSQKEFAKRMDMSEKHISKLINGEVKLTNDVAYRLEMILGPSFSFWNNLEARYREKLQLVRIENEMDEDLELLKCFPYNEGVKLGLLKKTRNRTERVTDLRRFFEVAKLSLLKDNPFFSKAACRRLRITDKGDAACLMWTQQLRKMARDVEVNSINIPYLRSQLNVIRDLTNETPEVFCDRLKEIFKTAGIVLIFLPHIKGSFLQGATFYEGNKIVLGVTARGKDADIIWFTIFHEIGHLVLDHLYLTEIGDKEEKEADEFAKNMLMPEQDYEAFINKKDFSKQSIERFAKTINIPPFIVLGRLQKELYVNYNDFKLNQLKQKYTIV